MVRDRNTVYIKRQTDTYTVQYILLLLTINYIFYYSGNIIFSTYLLKIVPVYSK